jgi:hypothetical protein
MQKKQRRPIAAHSAMDLGPAHLNEPLCEIVEQNSFLVRAGECGLLTATRPRFNHQFRDSIT